MAVTTRSRRARPVAGATRAADLSLSLAEHVCLALVAQGASHGWAIGSLLAPDGELGRIWSLSRPLTYRAIDTLADKRLVARRGGRAGQGRDRVVLTATPAGRSVTAAWLDEPVAHLRDVRTELLIKLELRRRTGLESRQLLDAQAASFEPLIGALSTNRPGDGDDPVVLWRKESARAVRRFLAQARASASTTSTTSTPSTKDRPDMRLSARNQLRANVVAVTHGEVMSTVRVALPDGQQLTAAITKDAAEDLDLAPGDAVVVVIKSTEVIIGKEDA